MPFTGGCHCGGTKFEFEAAIESAVACNCSICAKKGALLCAVPRAALRLLTPEDRLATYVFNNHVIAHRFCKTCGIHPFAEDAGAAPGRTAYVNLRCLDGFDLSAIPLLEFDGKSL